MYKAMFESILIMDLNYMETTLNFPYFMLLLG